MKKILYYSLAAFLFTFSSLSYGQNSGSEVLPNLDNNPNNTSVLNDQLRETNQRLLQLEGGIDINSMTTGILNVSRGGTGQDSSNWPAGDQVVMTSLGVWGHIPVINHFQIFTSSGTFTAPTGIYFVFVTLVAAGGGAAYAAAGDGTGGGGGAFIVQQIYAVIPGNTYTVTIGAGGVHGAPLSGGAGGDDTEFGSGLVLSVSGGSGGAYLGSAGSGGGAQVHSNNSNGSAPGGNGYTTIAGGSGSGIWGGGTVLGSGGASSPSNGVGYGGGGTAATVGSGNGGDGSDGICIVQY